jgi:hypothetical protein
MCAAVYRGRLGRSPPRRGPLLQSALVEVLIELVEVVSARRRDDTYDVIGDEGHQGRDDRQVRVLLSEALRFDDSHSLWHPDDGPSTNS